MKYLVAFLFICCSHLVYGSDNIAYYSDSNEPSKIDVTKLNEANVQVVNFINDLRSLDPQLAGSGLKNQKVIFVKNHHNKFDNGGGFFYWRPTSSSIRSTNNKAFQDNDGTIIHTCANEKGFWKRENSKSYYNVLWFGARSNNNASVPVNPEENRLAFQKAIYFAAIRNSYASKSGVKKGTAKASATIYIPFGKYNIANFGDSDRLSNKEVKCGSSVVFDNYPSHNFGAHQGKAIAIKGQLNGVTIKGDRATLYGEIDRNGNKVTNGLYYDDALNQHTVQGLELIDFNEAISFDTSNVALAIFKVQDCSFYNSNLGITSRQYHFTNTRGQDDGSRSTNFIIDGVKMFQVKRMIESTTDLLLIQNCYFNQYKPDFSKGEKHQPLMYLNSGTTILNSIFIPAKGDVNVEGSYWIDFNFAEDTSSRYLNIIGSRFSGENGGISVVKVSAQANDLNNAALRETNQVFISFVNSKVHSLRGGASNGKDRQGKGGVVTLGTNTRSNTTFTPNQISFYNTTNLISGNDLKVESNQLIVAENESLPLNLGNQDDYSFKIFIDEQSMQAYDRNWRFGNANWFPVSLKLLPYLNRQTRAHLMNRLQVVNLSQANSVSILKGKIVELKGASGSSNTQTLKAIKDSKPGDVITLTASDNVTSGLVFRNKSDGLNGNLSESRFILSSGNSFELKARGSITFVQLQNGDWLEMNRN